MNGEIMHRFRRTWRKSPEGLKWRKPYKKWWLGPDLFVEGSGLSLSLGSNSDFRWKSSVVNRQPLICAIHWSDTNYITLTRGEGVAMLKDSLPFTWIPCKDIKGSEWTWYLRIGYMSNWDRLVLSPITYHSQGQQEKCSSKDFSVFSSLPTKSFVCNAVRECGFI